MRIGQVASEAGVSIDTVRFYERRGVLPPAPRTAAGYRIFTEATVTRIRLARRLQDLGLTLDEITGALHARHEGRATCESERWRLHAALGRIESRLADLTRLRGEVRDTLAACEAGSCGVLAGQAGTHDHGEARRAPARRETIWVAGLVSAANPRAAKR